MRYSSLDNAEAGRARALAMRNNGVGSPFPVYATTEAMCRARGYVEPQGNERFCYVVRRDWQGDRAQAIEQYRDACRFDLTADDREFLASGNFR